jgi:hypothetical protein
MVNDVSTMYLVTAIRSATTIALDHMIQDRHAQPDRKQLHEIVKLANASASVVAMAAKAAGKAAQEAQPTIEKTKKKLGEAAKEATKAAMASVTVSLMDMASTQAITSQTHVASNPFRLFSYIADRALEIALGAERVARSAASSSNKTREQAAQKMGQALKNVKEASSKALALRQNAEHFLLYDPDNPDDSDNPDNPDEGELHID